jgi:hypothetical protein
MPTLYTVHLPTRGRSQPQSRLGVDHSRNHGSIPSHVPARLRPTRITRGLPSPLQARLLTPTGSPPRARPTCVTSPDRVYTVQTLKRLLATEWILRPRPTRIPSRRPSHVPCDADQAGHGADSDLTTPRFPPCPGWACPTRHAGHTLPIVKPSLHGPFRCNRYPQSKFYDAPRQDARRPWKAHGVSHTLCLHLEPIQRHPQLPSWWKTRWVRIPPAAHRSTHELAR